MSYETEWRVWPISNFPSPLCHKLTRSSSNKSPGERVNSQKRDTKPKRTTHIKRFLLKKKEKNCSDPEWSPSTFSSVGGHRCEPDVFHSKSFLFTFPACDRLFNIQLHIGVSYSVPEFRFPVKLIMTTMQHLTPYCIGLFFSYASNWKLWLHMQTAKQQQR